MRRGVVAVCRVHVAARVVLVHLWVFHPSVFDFGVAFCTGFVGSTECVLALLVLTVVCRCALVCAQQLRRLCRSCAVFVLAQPHGACMLCARSRAPEHLAPSSGRRKSPASRCHALQHGRRKHRELWRVCRIAAAWRRPG